MTDLDKWKAFLTEQNVGFVQESRNGITPVLWLSGQNVENFWAACDIVFDDAGGFDHIEVYE
jgi:hypothetical protein